MTELTTPFPRRRLFPSPTPVSPNWKPSIKGLVVAHGDKKGYLP